jgi:valyl-tRNA synthetase
MELSSKYNPQETQDKWLKFWKDKNVFHAKADAAKKPFTIVIPPPNVTGILHMGHALNNTLQDIMIRYKRMNGFEALWMPGTDHAGIATQNVVEKQLAKEGKKRQDLGRDEFLKRLWAWKQEYGDTIINQLEKLGSSCDWERTRFTMDDDYSEAVKEAFVLLHQKGLIYRGERIINWCPRCQTALSDEEAEHKEKNGKIYHLKYPLKDSPDQFVVVATTRPETMLGDTAVAVNPKDERYLKLIGKTLILPLVNREIKIIADDFVAAEFGSGAVKVTPAHDPNDFMMGQRHQLAIINVMNPDASINEQGGKYKGLDRFEARKRILADLEAMGLLEKIEDHKNAVGHCYRCDTIVEPYLSKQWFVKMKPLAKPASEAVQKGEIRIHPAHWSKVYTNWMEEIHDWCISRQIWWGHRVPVWYDKEGNYFVAKSATDAEAQAKARHGNAVELKQDEDVLDTWFSSWLWPFATLGWPKINPDLKFFYPTNTLMTASEILFFWVARMIMAGYVFMGEKPFSDVLIHGTVRDAKGRKMSKSLGNAIDPLEIIAEYGADALRFSLIINSGQDIFISKEKFEIGRNFANKIWNASRLVFMNTIDVIPAKAGIQDYGDNIEITNLDLPSRWIIARFYETLNKVNAAIESFHYSEAEILIQEFFWGSYCDWYLELIKSKFSDVNIQKTALFILKNSLKMMHPFIPFVTEEIYSKMNSKDECLSLATWPKEQKTLIDAKASSQMQTIIDIISAIRNVRSQWNIKPNETVDAFVVPADSSLKDFLSHNVADIQRMARLKNLTMDLKAPVLKNAATVLVKTVKVLIPLEGLIDLNAEKKRMSDDIAQKIKSIDGLNTRLNNVDFTAKAPEEIIAKEKERLDSLNKEVIALEGVLANLL